MQHTWAAPATRTPPTYFLAASELGPRHPILAYVDRPVQLCPENSKMRVRMWRDDLLLLWGGMGTEYSVLVKTS